MYSSYAAIQARVKKELEQERLEREKLVLAGQSAAESSESNSTTESAEQAAAQETHILAVSGVYFQCPLVSDEILEKEEWYEKIQDFFSAQLSEDEAGLSACLVIHSCNDGIERIDACIDTLCKYLDNIRNNPSESKYWKIRMSNKIFQVC